MIRYIDYDPQQRTLRVQFNKAIYDYFIVPDDVAKQAETMLAGEDRGWFHGHVKGIYPYRRVA